MASTRREGCALAVFRSHTQKMKPGALRPHNSDTGAEGSVAECARGREPRRTPPHSVLSWHRVTMLSAALGAVCSHGVLCIEPLKYIRFTLRLCLTV